MTPAPTFADRQLRNGNAFRILAGLHIGLAVSYAAEGQPVLVVMFAVAAAVHLVAARSQARWTEHVEQVERLVKAVQAAGVNGAPFDVDRAESLTGHVHRNTWTWS